MQINSINSTNAFASRCNTLEKLARKAEKRLAKRLTDPNTLMLDVENGIYCNFPSGRKFTGKYRIGTKDLEQFFHIKKGKLHFTLIRGLDGSKKIGGFGIGRQKQWVK